MSISIVFANANTASSDAVLKPLIRRIALRRRVPPTILDKHITLSMLLPPKLSSFLMDLILQYLASSSPSSLCYRCLFALLEVQPIVYNQSLPGILSLFSIRSFDPCASNGHLLHYFSAAYQDSFRFMCSKC